MVSNNSIVQHTPSSAIDVHAYLILLCHVFAAMTWVHVDLVLLVDLVRLVRNVAVWFPHPYASIHLEIILHHQQSSFK